MNQPNQAPGTPSDNEPTGFGQPPAYGHPDHQMPPIEETPASEFQDKTWGDVREQSRQEADTGYAPGEEPAIDYEEHDGPAVIHTDSAVKDGLNKCERCGSTEISLNVAKGTLRCHYCRHEWQEASAVEEFDLDTPISALDGITIGSGSAALVPGTDEVVSFKCSACGAEVVIDTEHAMQARCHWCRNTLSMNQQIPNGAVPDAVLPFSLPKDEAVGRISKFANSRKFFAHRKFLAEFTPENVIGVYLPYLIVDVNASMSLQGMGEHKLRQYTVGSDNNKRTVYDADVYQVARQFDLYVDDLTIESSSDKLNIDTSHNTNNIINTIMPFDTKNIVRFDANYLSGFSSQRRDTNVDNVSDIVLRQTRDIGRHQMLPTLRHYDRGVRWEHEGFEVKGQRWVSAYLPVWLYSYYEEKRNGKKLLHYIAVNGRTGETMGSIPINNRRLLIASAIAQVFGTIAAVLFL